MVLYQGDDLQAFNGSPIEINLITEDGEPLPEISKAIFSINNETITKEFENPEFPIYVELDSEDTIKLSYKNTGRLILWDTSNRKLTIDETLEFIALPEVYHGE